MQIGPAFLNVSGILSGRVVHATADELGRLGEMFQDEHKDGRTGH